MPRDQILDLERLVLLACEALTTALDTAGELSPTIPDCYAMDEVCDRLERALRLVRVVLQPVVRELADAARVEGDRP